jgi:ABC-type antimicrobial peptide transport system permease subunit
MERVLDTTLSVRRFQVLVLGFFALSALALVAMGVYGVVAYLVQQRAPEFGVRLALGADQRRILTMVLSDGIRMAAGGVVLGLIGAMAAGRVLAGMLYRARAFDPLVLAAVSLLVVGVVLLASLVPATRAARTSPGLTLKSD